MMLHPHEEIFPSPHHAELWELVLRSSFLLRLERTLPAFYKPVGLAVKGRESQNIRGAISCSSTIGNEKQLNNFL